MKDLPSKSNASAEVLDAVGVGVGPANLSLAALLATRGDVRARFFDRAEDLRWHPGMMFAESLMQVSFLKDLVTFVEPTSRYTFVNFLREKRRLYEFVNASFPRAPRWQFEEYLRWVASQLETVRFASEVHKVALQNDGFEVHVGDRTVKARNLVLGTGLSPRLPSCVSEMAHVLHSANFLRESPSFAGKHVVVIGGGQSGAELTNHMLAQDPTLPASLTWVTRRRNFAPLDEAPFTNAWYSPPYADSFYSLSAEVRHAILGDQKLASDGISGALLETIARRLYDIRYRLGFTQKVRLMPDRELVAVETLGDSYRLRLADKLRGDHTTIPADLVVFATGYEYRTPSCLASLAHRIDRSDGNYVVRPDYSIAWDGPAMFRIFVQNAARHARGIADPNLALVAWRSGTIANALAGEALFDLHDPGHMFS